MHAPKWLMAPMVAAVLIIAGCSGTHNPLDSGLAANGAFGGLAKKGGVQWNIPGDFATIQDAVNDPLVLDGHSIHVEAGRYSGALLTKRVEIKGTGATIIDSGPLHPAGLSQGFRLMNGSGGAVISNLQFEVDLAIMNGDGVSGVTVSHNRFINAIQAVSNWRGSGWDIQHNVIEDLRTSNGGGIGIMAADYSAVPAGVRNNIIAHNTITGTLHVHPNDGGGYDGSGIVLYADFRWGRLGAKAITDNRVVNNTINIQSDNPGVVDISAIELTESTTVPLTAHVIFDNAIGFNDVRNMASQIALTPADLADVNAISRNLGINEETKLHPSLFGPGGQ